MAQQKVTKSKTVAESAREAKKAEQHAKIEAARARAAEARIKAREAAKGRSAGFVNFIREQGVVGLAVGLAIGTAAGASVKVIVDQLINPLVALVTQGVDLSKLSWAVKVGHSNVTFGYGAVVSSLITLIATALVVYLVIHLAKLDRLDKKKD